MRIQHNIMAMNSYRNYTSNTSALSKNLEKLSSGYKINRAGDDAAGLAISEKMRAQITGLKAAQKNAKDGISLVQTAEGALTEVHSMLNRMVELADQSANGTYDDATDRANLQKEITQLKSEIDRIADATNFNGIKLLNGDLSGSSVSYTDSSFTLPAVGNVVGTNTVVHTGSAARRDPSFSIDLSSVNFKAAEDGASFDISIGGKTFTFDASDKVGVGGASGGTAFDKGDTLTGAQIATMLADAINANDSTVASSTGDNFKGIDVGGLVYKATAANGKLTFTLSSEDVNNAATDAQTIVDGTNNIPQSAATIDVAGATDSVITGADAVNAGNTMITDGVAAKAGTMASTKITLTAAQLADGNKLTIGDKTYVFKVGADSKTTANSNEVLIDLSDKESTSTDLLDTAISRLTAQSDSNGMYSIGSDASGQLTLTEKATYTGNADLTTAAGIGKTIKLSVKGAATADNSLTLQIGDTSDSFNQLKVAISDMHTNNLGINGIDISTQAGGQAAVDMIKAAINSVSSTRGDLGAAQNRLDHTINNLSVMTENIQDAEANIRDVDVAEEMMAYTKNNILVQSAQAMLAQANQVPQGVLQLLQ